MVIILFVLLIFHYSFAGLPSWLEDILGGLLELLDMLDVLNILDILVFIFFKLLETLFKLF